MAIGTGFGQSKNGGAATSATYLIASNGSIIRYNGTNNYWEVSNDGGVTFFPLISNSYKSLFVAASNQNTGDGSITNPYKTLDQAINFIVNNNLQGTGYNISVLDGIHTTALNYAQGVSINLPLSTGVIYTGSGYLFDDLGYDLQISGFGTFTCANGSLLRYGGAGRLKQFDFLSATVKYNGFVLGTGSFGYTTALLQKGTITSSDASGVCFSVSNFDCYTPFANMSFVCGLGKCFTADTRTTTTFESCQFNTSSDANNNALIAIPAGVPSTFYYLTFKRCSTSIRASNKTFEILTALNWNSSSQQLLWLENFRFNGGYSFGTLTPPLYSTLSVKFVDINSQLVKNYQSNEPANYSGGGGTFTNIANPAYGPITINNT